VRLLVYPAVGDDGVKSELIVVEEEQRISRRAGLLYSKQMRTAMLPSLLPKTDVAAVPMGQPQARYGCC